MRRRLVIITFVLVFIAIFDLKAQEIQFVTTEINYGAISKGANGVREFKFVNTGAAPLIITKATSSCTCLHILYVSYEPIMPGQTSTIKVKYDTQRVGMFQKYISVSSNAPIDFINLKVFGEVYADKALVE